MGTGPFGPVPIYRRATSTSRATSFAKELEDQPVLNANVLDFLREHPELIPDEWKGKFTFFWGTIYRHRDGDLYVRCLYWDGGRWDWGCDSLDGKRGQAQRGLSPFMTCGFFTGWQGVVEGVGW